METRVPVEAPNYLVGIRRNGSELVVVAEWVRGDFDGVVLYRAYNANEAIEWRDEQQARCDEINRRHCESCE